MNGNDLELIRGAGGWRRNRTEVVVLPDGPVMVKGQRPRRGRGWGRGLAGLGMVLGLPMLAMEPTRGGVEAQETEVRRLKGLRDKGFRVPRVLHVDRDFFVMEHLPGPNLADRLATASGDVLHLWCAGLYELLALHRGAEYLAQASARNFVVVPDGLVPVDLEEDPGASLPLEQAQARDWLFYLQSTVWLLALDLRPQMQAHWEAVVRAESPAVTDVLHLAARRLAWLRHLPGARRPWGRDVVSTRTAAAFLYFWTRQRGRS